MPSETLTITDNRTGKTYEVPIQHETIRATDLRKIKVQDDDFGLMTYDPAYMNTAACKSTITFIDGDKGILNYRGYPIEQLADDGEEPEHLCRTTTSTVVESAVEGESSRLRKLLSKLA